MQCVPGRRRLPLPAATAVVVLSLQLLVDVNAGQRQLSPLQVSAPCLSGRPAVGAGKLQNDFACFVLCRRDPKFWDHICRGCCGDAPQDPATTDATSKKPATGSNNSTTTPRPGGSKSTVPVTTPKTTATKTTATKPPNPTGPDTSEDPGDATDDPETTTDDGDSSDNPDDSSDGPDDTSDNPDDTSDEGSETTDSDGGPDDPDDVTEAGDDGDDDLDLQKAFRFK